jgi:hypothetical protein
LPFFRRHSSRHHSNSNTDNHKRQSAASPPAKRTQRSDSHSSTDSFPLSSPKNTKQIPCKDFFDNKGYCALGDSCPNDHGSNILTYEQQNYYPSYQQYNPETPGLKYDPHQSSSMYTRQPLSTGQRTLVTVVTNTEPLPLRQNDSSR